MTHTPMRCAARGIALTAMLLAAACGGSSTAPTPPPTGPIVSSITPNTGPSIGGTAVTINGQRFDASAIVTIGGVAATNVTFVSPNALSATTGSRNAGPADVAVTVAGQRGVLANGFTYTSSGPVVNAPPIIGSVTAVGNRANQPPGFADANEELTVTAVVTDAETAITALTFAWTADAGTLTGTGTSVKWKAPALFGSPITAKITLTVTERYTGTDAAGNPVPSEHTVSAVTSVSVHDSVKENGEMATAFLADFSNSSVSPETAVRYFYDRCGGKREELQDITDNRATYTINSYKLGQPTVSINFDGICPYRSKPGDACISLSCEWNSTTKATQKVGTARGTCYLTSVYRESKWQLCDSNFEGAGGTTSLFMR
jgi:hypothetical protein